MSNDFKVVERIENNIKRDIISLPKRLIKGYVLCLPIALATLLTFDFFSIYMLEVDKRSLDVGSAAQKIGIAIAIAALVAASSLASRALKDK